MNVLVDTPVWSLVLRRQAARLTSEQRVCREELSELIREGRVAIIGPIRQELLSGFRERDQFDRLKEHLRLYQDAVLASEDYEDAARLHNRCAAAGVAGSAVDLLICAAAIRRGWQIFTLDKDFQRYARHAPIALFERRRPLEPPMNAD